jgi:hypothetical protein
MRWRIQSPGLLTGAHLFAACFALQDIAVQAAPVSTPAAARTTDAAVAPETKAPPRVLFEADVYWNVGWRDRARDLYKQACSPGSTHAGLVAAYMASEGGGEQLYLEMQRARQGNPEALRSALDRLLLKRTDPYADPHLALALYDESKKTAPQAAFENEDAIAALLRMAAAPGPFNVRDYLRKHVTPTVNPGKTDGDRPNPYLLWDLAEKASAGSTFGKPDPELVLQLVARGPGELWERASAVGAAYADWKNQSNGSFSCIEHLASRQGVQHALSRMLQRWEQDQQRRVAELVSRAGSQNAASLTIALESAETLAREKSKYLHFHTRFAREWQHTFFLRWNVEKSLRLLESVFAGFKPIVQAPLSEVRAIFLKWIAVAESEVPRHLVQDGLPEDAGPCLAFSETDELKDFALTAETALGSFAEALVHAHPDVSLENWKSWLLSEFLGELDGSASALERWDRRLSKLPPAGTGRATQDPSGREALEKVLATFRSNLTADNAALFDRMKETAQLWFQKRTVAMQGSQSGEASRLELQSAEEDWLRRLEPLLVGHTPSHVLPVFLAETVLKVQTRASRVASPGSSENAEAEEAAWLEYRDTASRFFASLSPRLTEEDWKGWFSEERILDIPSNGLVYTEEEKARIEDEKFFAAEAELKTEFKRLEAVFRNPRSMDLTLDGLQNLVTSQDGRLRIISWDTNTGGSGHIYCGIAQFKSSDGRVGHVVLASPDGANTTNVAGGGKVERIDTIKTKTNGLVYLVWASNKTSTHRWTDSVTAFSLADGSIQRIPFFQTKRALLSDISIEYSSEAEDAGAGLRLVNKKDLTLLVPIISDKFEFSGKFFRYVFDGGRFVFSGIQ